MRLVCPAFVPLRRRVAAAFLAARLRAAALRRRVAAAFFAAVERFADEALRRRDVLRVEVRRRLVVVFLRRLRRGLINNAPVVGIAMIALRDRKRGSGGEKKPRCAPGSE